MILKIRDYNLDNYLIRVSVPPPQTEFTRSYWCFVGCSFFSFIFEVCRKTLTTPGKEMTTLTITRNNTSTSMFTSLWTVVVETFSTTVVCTEPGFLHEAWSPFVLDAMSFLTCRCLVPVTSSILWISDMQSLEL